MNESERRIVCKKCAGGSGRDARSRIFAAAGAASLLGLLASPAAESVRFPVERPERACFPRPFPDEEFTVSPPGFCWWTAGRRGEVRYRLTIAGSNGTPAYVSPLIDDPVHVPTAVLPPGHYTWAVEALDTNGQVRATRPPDHFTILDGAVPQPWVPAEELLARVPTEHPRLLFPRAVLGEVRATLSGSRREAFESLKRTADAALNLTPPAEPDYDKIANDAARRIAYTESFREMRRYHDEAMVALALMHLLSGDRRYGETAKRLLLGAAEWNPEGISSMMVPHGDEIGLGLARSAAMAYDWTYDLLDASERAKVEGMLVARADQMLRRLTRSDFLARPEESHNGRLPGYLIQHAIARAEEPRARAWMEYAMRAVLTVFPHWTGRDGGWAEGIVYGLAYNDIYLTPFECLRAATGFDMWQRPFYRSVRRFFMYNISPLGEIRPWGDGEDGDIPDGAASVHALMQFHALRYRDPVARGWVELLRTPRGGRPGVSAIPGIILADDLTAAPTTNLPPDAAFFGIGWAALHSDLAQPERDLMVMFKSSPYGSVSHSHADQNTFAIMKGGRALAIPAGYYFPTYGGPHHADYTRQTAAHNGILVNGRGQVVRSAGAQGRLAAFRSDGRFGYVCGDAAGAYGGALRRFHRHVLLARPSVVAIVDELETATPARFQWLLHAKERMDTDESAQTVASRRGDARMTAWLATDGGFQFSQTDEWPVAPNAGFPTSRRPEPPKQWHFTATTREAAARRRIAAVMFVDADGTARTTSDGVEGAVALADGDMRIKINLSPGAAAVLDAVFRPKHGEPETIQIAPPPGG